MTASLPVKATQATAPSVSAAGDENVTSVVNIDDLAATLSSLTLDPENASILITAIMSATTARSTPPTPSDTFDTTDLKATADPLSSLKSQTADTAGTAASSASSAPAPAPGPVPILTPSSAPAISTAVAQAAAANALARAAHLEAQAGIPAVTFWVPPSSPPAAQVYRQSYRGFVYEVPSVDAPGPFYCVTKGTRVGVFSSWQVTSKLVTGVSRSCQSRVVSLDAGMEKFHTSVDQFSVEVLV
ncbi:hypothetical protein BV22DRAFT_1134002 [Leucogyrophana mollusca]|uniref:Uncharacterized protein n=1 Tax=Leucogyrophana mollusca TaxID=85980 RepID=A0ACB8B0M6_9AGAM|nr:hypothetical protein BV22DRAFT_1134002 [Leucogyrophana mollusca]